MPGRGISWVLVGALILFGFALASPGADPDRGEPRQEDRRRPSPAERSPAPGIPAAARRAPVTGVADGDTIDLAGLGSSRLIGIDTPEIYFGAECFGAKASAFTKSVLPVGTVVFVLRGVERKDDFNRDLVYVWLADGTFVNALLARKGYAVPLTIAPNDRFAPLFSRLAMAADAAHRGLWARRACDGDADLPAG